MSDCLLLVDAYSQIYRAFFAIRSLTGPNGEPVNAIFGFTKMLRKMLTDYHPSHCAVVFDLGAPQARLSILPSYKEQRPPTPPDLDAQLPAIREVISAMCLTIVEIDGEEADDLIATLAVRAAQDGWDALIASNDKDFTQIVGPRIRLVRPNGNEAAVWEAADVEARYGVKPEQMVDFLSLTGDSVDNIRGVSGVGEKTAAELLRKFGSVDRLLAAINEISKPKLREAVRSAADQLRINRQLVSLRTDLKVDVTLESLKLQVPDYTKLIEICRRFGFKSLRAELDKESQRDAGLFANL
jgi:DNA polymerase-1